jgi:hypothetical protein
MVGLSVFQRVVSECVSRSCAKGECGATSANAAQAKGH